MGASGPYLQQREVTRRFEFPPGAYVIIPSLLKKNKRMKFILRVYIEGALMDENKDSKRKKKDNRKENKLIIKEMNKLKDKESKLNTSISTEAAVVNGDKINGDQTSVCNII